MTNTLLLLPGDGIGHEIMPEVEKLIAHLGKAGLADFSIDHGLVGGTAYDSHGVPISEGDMDKAKAADAVIFGSVGGPKWDKVPYEHRPEAGLLRLRKDLGLFANLRPAIVYPALADASALKRELVEGLDILIVRELTGGVYFGEPKQITDLGKARGNDAADTDMIIPKQYLKTIKRTGLGTALFSELRYNEDGTENPDFVLNKPAYRGAKIIVAGDNFGCGSSREHAPWALLDFGVRCVISTSFADIFYNNCFKNGILPLKVTKEQLALLLDDASRGANATLTIDLAAQTIQGPDGGTVHFDIDPARKQILLEGLDDIAGTLKHESEITGFESKMADNRPWL